MPAVAEKKRPINGESATDGYRARLEELREEAKPYREAWLEARDYVDPEMSRYLVSDSEKKRTRAERFQKILNTAARRAISITAAGLQSGMTSQHRPWFMPTIPDKDLLKYKTVAQWMDDCQRIILEKMGQTNLYAATHSNHEELVGFGGGAMIIDEDYQQPVRCRPLSTGEYFLGLDSQFRPNVMYRRFSMTAGQMIGQFGRERCSAEVERDYDNNKRMARRMIVHAMEPTGERDSRYGMYWSRPYKSVYYDEGANKSETLREKRYRRQPFAVSRWGVHGSDVYGTGPISYAMGDIKGVQAMEKSKYKGIQMNVDPVVIAPTHWRGRVLPRVAGSVIHDDTPQGQQGVREAWRHAPNTAPVAQEILEKVRQIYESVYADLFRAITQAEGDKTAYEIARIYEEQLLQLGSAIGRLQGDYLRPIFFGYFDILLNWELLPEPPRELWGMELQVDFIGMLVQAQRAVDTAAIERTFAFAGVAAQLDPTAPDALDGQEAVAHYGELVGVPATIIRGKKEREERAAIRRQQIEEQQMLARTAAGADAAKKMAETSMEGDSLLSRAVGG